MRMSVSGSKVLADKTVRVFRRDDTGSEVGKVAQQRWRVLQLFEDVTHLVIKRTVNRVCQSSHWPTSNSRHNPFLLEH